MDLRCIHCGADLEAAAQAPLPHGATAAACGRCGARYRAVWGVPFFGGYDTENVPALMEATSHLAGFDPAAIEAEVGDGMQSFAYWEDLLRDYHTCCTKESFLRDRKVDNAETAAGWFPNRYAEWRTVRHLLQDIDLRGKKVLDVGAGFGFDSYRLFAAGAEVTALESQPILALKGRKALPQLRWIGGFGQCLPFRSGSFDLAFCNAALHHMSDIPRVVGEMLRVLRPGGWLVTSCDPFRADAVSDDAELQIFARDPAVLMGVNERVPRFSEYADGLQANAGSVQAMLATENLELHALPGLIARVLRRLRGARARRAEGIRSWRFPAETAQLHEASGAVAIKAQLRTPITGAGALQASGTLEAFDFAELLATGNSPRVMSELARRLPPAYADLPFATAAHSKFLLMNGWLAPSAGTPGRRFYRRGRWFLRRAEGERMLEVAASASDERQGTARLLAHVGEKQVLDAELECGRRCEFRFDIAHLSVGVPAPVEFALAAQPGSFEADTMEISRLAAVAA